MFKQLVISVILIFCAQAQAQLPQDILDQALVTKKQLEQPLDFKTKKSLLLEFTRKLEYRLDNVATAPDDVVASLVEFEGYLDLVTKRLNLPQDCERVRATLAHSSKSAISAEGQSMSTIEVVLADTLVSALCLR